MDKFSKWLTAVTNFNIEIHKTFEHDFCMFICQA